MKGKKMHISNSKHSKFKIINSNDNKFILRLFNFKNFNKKHHSKNDLKNNNVFVLDLKFNSIKDIYDHIKTFNDIDNLKSVYYSNWLLKKFIA
jgi:hypothetical protein|tara:strand:+ start:348 stop:626 length:279 start_codon:yes stop_codon:yes gene_type:complete